jgi:hypothetical protein
MMRLRGVGKGAMSGSVRVGKAYVSVHLLPLYMNPALNRNISPELKKRMQGKACFNFKTVPEKQLLREFPGSGEGIYRILRFDDHGVRADFDQPWHDRSVADQSRLAVSE